MKQAQRMQQQMEEIQAALAKRTVAAAAGRGRLDALADGALGDLRDGRCVSIS